MCGSYQKFFRVTRRQFYNLADFRAIHILPVFAKLYEILLAEQINEFIALRGLMTPIQSAYRPAHRTMTALLKIETNISRVMDDRLVAVLLDHQLLCSKLTMEFQFDETATKLIRSYLTKRKQAV